MPAALRRLPRLALALACLSCPAAVAAGPDGGMLVVLDPGHGGDRPGAIGPSRELEKDIALGIALRLREVLLEAGYDVLLTREHDVNVKLTDRIALANRQGADAFVSIHLNSMPPGAQRRKVSGVETYFLSADATDDAAARLAHEENSDDEEARRAPAAGAVGAILADLARTAAHADSSRLAYALHARMVATGPRDRGVRQAPFFVLEGAAMPAVLVEVGYISQAEEARRLSQPAAQEQVARALAAGLEDYRREVLQRRSPAARTVPGRVVPDGLAPGSPAPAPGPEVAPAAAMR